jgi:hypothetical protein
MTPRTRELLWLRALGDLKAEDAVTWALEELAEAPSTPNLAALAGLLPPLYNEFEVDDLLRRALEERGVVEAPRDEIYRDFLREMAERIINGQMSPADGCATLADAHGGDITRGELQPFYLLRLAVTDLRAGEMQSYCPELTLETFDDAVLSAARQLLLESATATLEG